MNIIYNVPLSAGLIGWLADSPQNKLNKAVKKCNAKGYKVVQIIPSESGNFLINIFRTILLVCTFFMWTTANGYYLVLEKIDPNSPTEKIKPIETERDKLKKSLATIQEAHDQRTIEDSLFD